jgi:hypothetical protein
VVHFAHEGSPGGPYDALGPAPPECRTPAGSLVQEHYEILADLRDLAEQARERMRQATPDLHEAAVRLAERLEGHEAHEDLLAAALERRGRW